MMVPTEIWFQLTVLLGIAVASHFIVTRLGQSMVVAEIVIGIIIGPSLVGIITDQNYLVAPFAQLGAIFLLFAIGLECNLNEIYTRKSLVIASCGVAVPWVAGFLFGLSIGQPFGSAVFIGAILVATSVAVTAGILVEMGQLDTKVGKTIIGAAVVDDILGMIVLTISIGASGSGVAVPHLLLVVVAAGLFIGIGAFVGSRYLGRVMMYIESKSTKVQHSGFLFALTVMFLYAFIAEVIMKSAIIGAFVAGTMFSAVPIKKEFDSGAKFLASVFAPIFFISIGIMVNLKGITGANILALGILLTLIAILTKVIGCSLPAKAMGMSTKESLTVGYGMSPRCEVALIIALLGLSEGIITQDIYFMAVFMAVLTTLVTPPFLKMLLKKEKKTKSKAELLGALHRKKPLQKKSLK
jgi:Kef-type K+ transport system membrane component KefB